MRVLAALSFVLALATGALPVTARQTRQATQNNVPATPPAPGAVRVPVPTSDLLTHSPLAACNADNARAARAPKPSRIVTWNIRAARSAPVGEIATELQAMQADVIALQEVDVRVRRTGFVDEPAVLATALGFQYAFAAAIKWDEGDYGLAVLSRWPLVNVRRYRLDATAAVEPRIVLEVTICAGGRPLHLFNHHADGRVQARDTGFAELRRIVQADVGHGILVLGDFNEQSNAPRLRRLFDAGLVDLGAGRNLNTAEDGRIDYVLADGPMARLTSPPRVWSTDKSDHDAVLTDLKW